MLILTRRIGESLMIGTDVRITVLSHEGNQLKLGIRAPRTLEVHRQEVFDRIQQERAAGDGLAESRGPRTSIAST